MAHVINRQIDSFCNNEEKNIFTIKKKKFERRTIEFTILEDMDFIINLDINGNVATILSSDSTLKGEWLKGMKAYLESNKKATVEQVLEKATELFDKATANITPGEEETLEESLDLGDNAEYETVEQTPVIVSSVTIPGYDPFVMDSPSTEMIKKKQKEALLAFYDKQIEKTVASGDFGKFVNVATSHAMTNWRDVKADKEMYARFFVDGFNIDDGPLLKKEDPNNAKVLESFEKGFVPSELSRGAQNIDLHIIYEDCTYQEYMERKQEKLAFEQQKAFEQDEVDEELLEMIKQQSLQELESRQSAPVSAPSSSSQSKPQAAPVQSTPAAKPQPQAAAGHTVGGAAGLAGKPVESGRNAAFLEALNRRNQQSN